jgi:hypothetical protein
MPRFNIEDYVDVDERIDRFWEQYPDGRIITNLVSPEDDFTQCRYVAYVYKHRDHHVPDASGWAFEIATPGAQGPNATSHEENCETSAIGRALANLGFTTSRKGAKEPRPSKQEMDKVQRSGGLPVVGIDGGGKFKLP